MEKNLFFLEILCEIAFLNPDNLRKRQKEKATNIFTAILDRLLSR